MKVKEREGATLQEVGKPRAVIHRRRPRNSREGGDGTAIKGGGEDGIASPRGKTVEGRGRTDFLKENQVWTVLAEKSGQAAEVMAFASV